MRSEDAISPQQSSQIRNCDTNGLGKSDAIGLNPHQMTDTRSKEMLASMAPEELRTAMRTLGYRTQSDLANAIGVSRSAVSLWLEGKVGVPRPVAMLLRMLINAQRRAY